MMISDLPSELVEEIISRVPMKLMGMVRSTCKKWNSLSKDQSFVKKHIGKVAASTREREFLIITGGHGLELISYNLNKTNNNDNDLSMNRKGTLIGRECTDPLLLTYQVFHCNGVLLCVLGNMNTRLVVWNPYWGNTRWIDERKDDSGLVKRFAFGYDKSCGSHKILKWFDHHLEIFNLRYNSWKVHNVTLDLDINIGYRRQGVSLKGNTYWHARSYESRNAFIMCFDFTRERFGPRLPLPFGDNYECDVYLSAVREEKLAMLIRPWGTKEMEVWITDKIEPDAVTWTNFFKVYTKPQVDITPQPYMFKFISFFIEEEKKIAVVFFENCTSQICTTAYIIGENGYCKRVDLRKSPNIQLLQFVCSYVPTSVQI
ncbi:unnamed protein product [Microthlaspi erraticum]|uniref:F-box domain-containing protein n=1 Tax=Microthlaspi erraticum TaxID=1685480 RepID=A0A6D2HEZ0_9BRAS|nr:unnamed protein product [Microthlaspi erraticum]